MSFTDEYLELRKKKKKNKEEKDIAPLFTNKTTAFFDKDISPVIGKATKTQTEEETAPVLEKPWYKKGQFEDGYDFGDVTKTILGVDEDTASLTDLTWNSLKRGFYNARFGEESFKAMQGQDNQADEYKKILSGEEYQFAPGNDLASGVSGAFELFGQMARQYTNPRTLALTGTAAGAAAIAGQAGPQVLVPEEIISVPLAASAGFVSGSAISALEIEGGLAYNEMLEAGISEDTASKIALAVGTVNASLEMLQTDELLKAFKATSATGSTKTFTKKILDELKNRGVDIATETAQEVAQEGVTITGTQIGSKIDNDEWAYSVEDVSNRLLDTAKSSALSFGFMNVPAAGKNIVSIANEQKQENTLTENEQKVVDKVFEDRVAEEEQNGKELSNKDKNKIYNEVLDQMVKGYISTDTIEEVLGGETYKTYKETVDSEDALQSEFDTLYKMKQGDMTGEQIDRMGELRKQLSDLATTSQRNQLKTQLNDEVLGLVKGSRLAESYNERARRGQAFEADLTQYDAKQQAVVQKAIDSGILNNTNRTHEFVDLVAKVSADKGVLFDFTNNENLKASGFAVDGKSVNGYVTKDGVTVNIQSAKALNSVVGHEITHVLEGTELYEPLQQTMFDYAKSKGEYDSRLANLTELYKDIKDADVNAELTADLVGDYLFTDKEFVQHLSVNNRNIFQKIYDEIKYLCKVATAGSKEARELERVKKAFEDAYRGNGEVTDTKYSVSDKNIKDVSTDYAYGETYFAMSYTQDGKTVATLEYGEYDGKPNVKMIKVDPEYRRKGIATKLLQELQKKYPDTEIDFGMSTPDGTKLLDSITYDVTDEAVVADRQKLKDLQTELNELQEKLDILYDTENLTEAQETEMHKLGDRWEEVYDAIRELEPTLRGKKATKTFVKTDAKYSISDSDGKQLTKEQQDYFKDSKMRDENGNLKVMYHGSQDAGFHVFDPKMSDDDTSFFFVDRNDVAASYSGTTETYEAKTIHSAEDMRSFLQSIGYEGYEVFEEGEKHWIEQDGDYVAGGKTWKELYEEFCWYEGVGEGDANYKVYLNLKNPLVVDVKGRNWDNVSREFSQEIADRYHSLTAEEKEALHNLTSWGEISIFRDEIKNATDLAAPTSDETAVLASAYYKLAGKENKVNMYDLFTIAEDNFSEESINQWAVKQLNTRDFAQRAKEQGYDGVIFNNIVDVGGYGGEYTPATVAIAFDSNQIKSVANEKPTADPDIRYSLSEDSQGRELSAEQKEFFQYAKTTDEQGRLKPFYHGTARADRVGNMFDPSRATSGPMAFFTDNRQIADNYARDKADTSLEYDEMYDDYYTQFRMEINGKNMSISEAWKHLPPSKQFEIREKAKHVKMDEDYENVIYDETAQYGVGGFDAYTINSHKGNILEALTDSWLESGTIYGEEQLFLDVLKLVGLDNVQYMNPDFRAEKTYEVYLNITNPFTTSNISEEMLEAFRTAAENTEYVEGRSADTWDKRNIPPEQWIERLEDDIKKGTTHSWTSIPDFVTDVLKEKGYDGIFDTGGKGGGVGHTVAIPFYSEQIKNVDNKTPTTDPDIRRSLSAEGETPKSYGNYNIYGKDISLDGIAPVKETEVVAENATPNASNTTTNTSPVLDNATVTQEDLFPNDLAPVEAELESLYQQKDVLETKMQEAITAEDMDAWTKVSAEYDAVMGKISELESAENERFDSLVNEEAPPETVRQYDSQADTTPIAKKDIADIAKEAKETLALKSTQMGDFRKLIEEYSQSENPSREQLFNDLKENFGTYKERNFEQTIADAKRYLRSTKLRVSDTIIGDIADFADFKKRNRGKVILSANGGLDVDSAYQELNGSYPHLFPESITNPTDQLLQIVDVANKNSTTWVDKPIGDETLWEVANDIADNVSEMKQIQKEADANELAGEAFTDLVAHGDDFAPIDASAVTPVTPVAEENTVTTIEAPIAEEYEAIKPKPTKKTSKEPKLARATPAEQARAEILTEEPSITKEKPSAWAKAKNLVLDKGMVFEDLSLATGNRELQARFNSIRYAEGKAQKLIGEGNAFTSSLKSIQEAVEKTGKTKQFYEYLYHMHNIDRMTLEERFMDTPNKAVFGDSVTAEVSREAVAKLEKANPEFKQFAKDVYTYNKYLRAMLVEGGVISKETAKLWETMYPHYVPIRRVGDTGLNVNVPLDTGRTGVNAPIKKATGGSRDILPLFDTMGQRTIQTYKAIAKNRFGVELKNTLGTTIADEATSVDEAIDSIDTQDGLLQEGKNGKKPTFTVFENGKKVTFEITEEMYDAMKPTSDLFAGTSKTLNTISNIRRGTLTEYNPWFMLKNAVKDIQDVLINSQHAARTYANIPSAIKQMATNGHLYQEYMDNGGDQNTYFDNQTNTFTKDNKAWEIAKKATGLDAISKANNIIERLPRLAEYIASRKAGRSVDVAMLDAARVTTNFAAGGDATKWLNRNGATFLNASVQGAVQQARNIREAKANGLKGWASLAAKYTLAGLPAVLLNNLLWDDDEEYEELSEYVKENYYIVGKFGNGKFVRIPKGRTVAVIQNAFEQIENLITGDDEVDLGRFLDLVVTNLAPNNPLDNNIIAPIVQVANNETWYGEDLVPTRLQDLPEAEQYDESTDSISRWLGEKLDFSPVKINYLLDQYSGVIGDTFLPMLTPEAESGDNSFLGNMIAPLKDMFTTDSVMNNQNVSDFYETMDELTTNAKSSTATDEDVLKYKYINSVNAELSELYTQKREIQNSDAPDNVKYAKVRMIQEAIDSMTEESLNTYNNVNIDGNYATVGDRHYRWYEPGEDSDAEAGWQKITDKQLEKQEDVTKGLGISASEYWSNKEEYDYAYENPEKYAVAKSVGGYKDFKNYSSELYDIKADKDSSGKSISGSRKEKVIDYVNNLDIDYGMRLILFKNEYNADDTYNYDIINYLNSREDISYDEMEAILKELGFTVDSKGNVTWD